VTKDIIALLKNQKRRVQGVLKVKIRESQGELEEEAGGEMPADQHEKEIQIQLGKAVRQCCTASSFIHQRHFRKKSPNVP